jgi:hypothetical protein
MTPQLATQHEETVQGAGDLNLFVRSWRPEADERLKREFPLMTLPVLILHGTADTATKPIDARLPAVR